MIIYIFLATCCVSQKKHSFIFFILKKQESLQKEASDSFCLWKSGKMLYRKTSDASIDYCYSIPKDVVPLERVGK